MKKFIPLSIPDLRGNVKKHVMSAIEENWISSAAPGVKKFEDEIAKIASSKFAIATITGSAALHLALKTLNLGLGDKVIIPDFTFAASINAVELSGATPIIVDVSREDWTLDTNLLEQVILQESPAAIIVVHTLGHPAKMNEILKLKRKYKIKIIEDAAGAMGAEYKKKKVGCLGDAGIFSFNGNKVLTTGSGGALLLNSKKLYTRANLLAKQGKNSLEYKYKYSGFNYKMSNLNASLGYPQIKLFKILLKKKIAIAKFYDLAFKTNSRFSLMPRNNKVKSSCWLYSLKMNSKKDAKSLIRFLKKRKIESRLFWENLSSQKPYRNYLLISKKVSNDLSKKIVSLPCSTNLTKEDQKTVIQETLTWANRN
jgi:perosamine synthetase